MITLHFAHESTEEHPARTKAVAARKERRVIAFSKNVYFAHLLEMKLDVKEKCAKSTFMEFSAALRRILNPLVRLAIARGMTFPELSDLLKSVFVARAEADFGLEGKRMTDSRISLLTGLQRRDVRAHREQETLHPPESAGALPRVIARWTTDPAWLDRNGDPITLDRAGSGLSFDALVASISRDMHPRTLLDELERQGAVTLDGEKVSLTANSYLPVGDGEKLGYFGANLGDHVEAATANLTEQSAPFFERAVHYNQLSEASITKLEALARQRQQEVLQELNAEALSLQKQDAKTGSGTTRFRCGAFVYVEKNESATTP